MIRYEEMAKAAGYYLSATLRQEGYQTVLTATYDDESLQRLADAAPFAVCLSTTMIIDAPSLISLVRRIRQYLPDALLIAGGVFLWKSYYSLLLILSIKHWENDWIKPAILPPIGLMDEKSATQPTPTESMLVEIWENILGKRPIGIHDDFFELGGNSLAAAQAQARVKEAFQTEFSVQDLFEQPTISAIAGTLDKELFGGSIQTPALNPQPPRFQAVIRTILRGCLYPLAQIDIEGEETDLNTGLIWQQAHNAERLSYYDAKSACDTLNSGGYSDWRLPTITEPFSITDFRGSQANKPHRASEEPRFYLDAEVFDLAYPDESILAGDRFGSHKVEMMGQTWSSTIYTGQHWGKNIEAAFFFNFFDGHIKQAPTRKTTLFYRCVRGEEYGQPDFRDNGDGTVTDRASGLMWQQADDGHGRNWEAALACCENLTLAGQSDWRLPNVKELQSIVDYSRHDPALDTGVFTQTDPDGWCWSSTTHGDNINMAAYVCFGKCTSSDGTDVHGAGAQRADPKSGDPADYSSIGDQAEEVRIFNYVRCVRN